MEVILTTAVKVVTGIPTSTLGNSGIGGISGAFDLHILDPGLIQFAN